MVKVTEVRMSSKVKLMSVNSNKLMTPPMQLICAQIKNETQVYVIFLRGNDHRNKITKY